MKLDVAYRFPCAEEFARFRDARRRRLGLVKKGESRRQRAERLGVSLHKLLLIEAEAANG